MHKAWTLLKMLEIHVKAFVVPWITIAARKNAISDICLDVE
jgi:hypothetical protein